MGIIPREVKLVVGGILIIAGALWFRGWLNDRDRNQSNEATAAQAGRTGEAVVAIGEQTGTAVADVEAEANRVRNNRQAAQTKQQALRNENPNVMAWSNGVIPVELRDADRAARLAGQRLSDLQSGIETDSSAAKD